MVTQKTLDLPDAATGALALWKQIRGGRDLPKRSDFKPFEWREWVSDISIIELHEGANRFFVSLHGGRTQEAIGVNLHKRYMESCLDPDSQPLAFDPYHESVRTGLPTFSMLTPMLYPGVFRAFPRLVLPFTDDTPEGGPGRIDRFVTWIGSDSKQQYDLTALCAGQHLRQGQSAELSDRMGLTILAG